MCRVGNGHDDKTIDRINRELKVKKISKVRRITSQVLCTRTPVHHKEMKKGLEKYHFLGLQILVVGKGGMKAGSPCKRTQQVANNVASICMGLKV